MTRPAWHTTWSRMKELTDNRRWLTRTEILKAVRARGLHLSAWAFRRVFDRLDPRPVMRHGMYRYTTEHLAAVVAAAERMAMEGDR